MNRVISTLAVCMVLAVAAPAQFQSQLTTTYAFNNGQSGNMFDIVAINDVTICGFDVNLDAGTWNMEVWVITGGGTYTGQQNNAAAWTLLGSAMNVVSAGPGVPTLLPIAVDTSIQAGTTQGFYVTVTNGTPINYTNGSVTGAVYAQDANMQILEGSGHSYPFGSNFNPRIWNGTVFYELGLNPFCVSPRPPTEFTVNQPGSSLTISGLPDPGQFSPIVKSAIVGMPETLDLASTNVGNPYEVAVLLPGMAQGFSALGVTLGGQAININLGSPGLFYLNGGASPNLTTSAFPSPAFTIPFTLGSPAMAAAQMAVADPASIAGFTVSHAVQYSAEMCNASQDFDNLPIGIGNAPPGWVNPSSGTAWNVHTAGTSSAATGPTSAFNGANYMYCETSVVAGTNFVLDTCPVDLTQISGVTGTLNFALSRIGATTGTLNLFVDDGTGAGFVPITDPASGTPISYVGADPSQAQGGTEWSMESIPFLHNVASSVVAFRFSYTSGTSFTGDIGIDAFNVN